MSGVRNRQADGARSNDNVDSNTKGVGRVDVHRGRAGSAWPFGGVSMIGWLLTAAGAICLALVFARLAAILPRADLTLIYTKPSAASPASGSPGATG